MRTRELTGRRAAVPSTVPCPALTRSLTVVVAVSALAGAAGAALVWAASPAPAATAKSPDVPVNAGATDARDLTANNSPTAVRNPRRPGVLAVVNRIDAPRYSCALRVSVDGGSRWQERALPFPAGEDDPPRCFAPDAAYGSDGTLHIVFTTLAGTGNSPHALWVIRSPDDGRSFSTPLQVAGALAFQPRLAADPGRTDLWLTWLQARDVGNLLFPEAGYPIVAARSRDGGRSWSAPVNVSAPTRARVVAPAPVMAAGTLFVLYLDVGDDALDYHGAHAGRGGEPYPGRWSLVLARSADEGKTWQETVVAGDLRPIARFVVFLPPTPSLAVDGRRVYAAFHDGRGGDPDVWLWASGDGGRTFAAPHRVNDTPPADGTWQYLPRVAVAPDGRLDVLYYDRRNDPQNVLNEASLQSSFDHGASFSRHITLSRGPFDSRVGFGGFRNLPDLGSRNALVSGDHAAVAVWTDTRGGTESGKQDLATSAVTFRSPSAVQARAPVLAVALAGAGLIALFALWRQRTEQKGGGDGAGSP